MANICWNYITLTTTDSEWKEINDAFENDKIDWSIGLSAVECSGSEKMLSFETKWDAKPLSDGSMRNLSDSYPSVLFEYRAEYEGGEPPLKTWLCNGQEIKKSEREKAIKNANKEEIRRFVKSSRIAADGISHRVELMPDGRVAADGENRFGECDIYFWRDITQISCGNWHTVGLRSDGTPIACGSNANGQCDFSDLSEKATSVSCGRYHTAVLLESGKVIVEGNLGEMPKDASAAPSPSSTAEAFPLFEEVSFNAVATGREKLQARVDRMKVGDELLLKKTVKGDDMRLDVLNMRGETIGSLRGEIFDRLIKVADCLRITVEKADTFGQDDPNQFTVTLKIDCVFPEEGDAAKKVIREVIKRRVADWPPVSKIKSIFDGVLGVTAKGEAYADGLFGCSENEILQIAKEI